MKASCGGGINMAILIPPKYTNLEEINLDIYDSEISYYGGSQNWFPNKSHKRSGCGPVAAANITAYLSRTFEDKYNVLYPCQGVINKKDFINHMIEIRKYVRPGFFGLTSVHQFSDNVLAFSIKRGVNVHFDCKRLKMVLETSRAVLNHLKAQHLGSILSFFYEQQLYRE